MKYEVTAVSGKNVTLLVTGIYNNGTLMPGNNISSVFNIEKNSANGLFIWQIIASNLNQGDLIPGTPLIVNTTENRNYLGESIIVNTVKDTTSSSNIILKGTYVYDRATGICLEAQLEQTESAGISTATFSVIETNIFGSSLIPTQNPTPTLSSNPSPSTSVVSSPSIPEFTPIIIVPILIAMMLIGLIIYKKKKINK